MFLPVPSSTCFLPLPSLNAFQKKKNDASAFSYRPGAFLMLRDSGYRLLRGTRVQKELLRIWQNWELAVVLRSPSSHRRTSTSLAGRALDISSLAWPCLSVHPSVYHFVVPSNRHLLKLPGHFMTHLFYLKLSIFLQVKNFTKGGSVALGWRGTRGAGPCSP